jgi:hypothetical protein
VQTSKRELKDVYITPSGRHEPAVRNYRFRKEWAERNVERTTLAFYNSGQSIFIDPTRSPTNSHYDYEWQWISYRRFAEPRLIRVDEHQIFCHDHNVMFQHHGHNVDRIATISLGRPWPQEHHSESPTRISIPPLCVLYVGVRFWKVRDIFLQYCPLPLRLVQPRYPGLLSVEVQKMTCAVPKQ